MKYTTPDFYKDFKCIAGDCLDTCCAGWQIMIDEDTMTKYNQVPGGLGNRIHNSINPEEGCFFQYEGRCAFLNEDNLCDLCIEGGEELFCHTCRTYPRHIEEFENVREISLAISCPEVARMLLTRQEPLQFCTEEREEPEESYDTFNYRLYALLQQTRTVMIQILQDRRWSILDRMGTALALGHDVGRRVHTKRLHQIPKLTEQYRVAGLQTYSSQTEKSIRKMGQTRRDVMHRAFQILYQMEVLEPEWMPMIRQYDHVLYQQGEEYYQKSVDTIIDSTILEHLMVYFVYTYFTGSVYDGYIYEKVKFALVSTLLIQELGFARRAEKGSLKVEDIQELAHSFSKEVEHSDINLATWEREMHDNAVFSIENLVFLCL